MRITTAIGTRAELAGEVAFEFFVSGRQGSSWAFLGVGGGQLGFEPFQAFKHVQRHARAKYAVQQHLDGLRVAGLGRADQAGDHFA